MRLLTLILLMYATTSVGQNVVVIEDSAKIFNLGNAAEYFKDTTGRLTIGEILKQGCTKKVLQQTQYTNVRIRCP